MRKWIVYLSGLLVLEGAAVVSILTRTIEADPLLIMGLYWLWSGIIQMLDQIPGRDNGRFDRWEKQVYGLAIGVMGLLWTAISFTLWVDQWIPVLLTLVPSALIALVGRFWYVEKKRRLL